jgi:hypothetical protein
VDINIHKEWVKGHYTGKDKLQHNLNDMADHVAVQYNSTRRLPNAFPPILNPMSEAEILQNSQIITSRLPQLIKKSRHTNDIQQAIQR